MERNSEKKDGGAGGAGEYRKLARVGMTCAGKELGSSLEGLSPVLMRNSKITGEDRISVSVEGGVVGRVRGVGAIVAVRRKHDCDSA